MKEVALWEFLSKLRRLDMRVCDDHVMRTAVSRLFRIPIHLYDIPQGSIICRVRPTPEFGSHTTSSSLSYPPTGAPSVGRANLKGDRVFYGSIFKPNGNQDWKNAMRIRRGDLHFTDVTKIVSLREVIKGINEASRLPQVTPFPVTYGFWETTSLISVVGIHKRDEDYVTLDEFMLTNPANRYKDHLMAGRFLAEQFSKYPIEHEDEYRFTAWFTHLYLKRASERGELVHGIAYPSVESEGIGDFGVCLALDGDLTSNNLRLSRVIQGVVYAGFGGFVFDNEKSVILEPGQTTFSLSPVKPNEHIGPTQAEVLLRKDKSASITTV